MYTGLNLPLHTSVHCCLGSKGTCTDKCVESFVLHFLYLCAHLLLNPDSPQRVPMGFSWTQAGAEPRYLWICLPWKQIARHNLPTWIPCAPFTPSTFYKIWSVFRLGANPLMPVQGLKRWSAVPHDRGLLYKPSLLWLRAATWRTSCSGIFSPLFSLACLSCDKSAHQVLPLSVKGHAHIS